MKKMKLQIENMEKTDIIICLKKIKIKRKINIKTYLKRIKIKEENMEKNRYHNMSGEKKQNLRVSKKISQSKKV